MNNRCLKSTLKRTSLAVMALGLAACVQQPQQTLSYEDNLAALTAAHKYGAALRLVSSNENLNAEQRESTLQTLQQRIANFEEEQNIQASVLQQDKQYGDAIALYQQALHSYPESLVLREQLQALYTQRDDYVRTLQLTYLVDRAKALGNEVATITAISDARRDDPVQQALLQELLQERDATALSLLQEGQRRLALQEIGPALHYLQLSQELKADARTETALRLAKRQQKPVKAKRVIAVAKPEPVAEPSELELALAAYQQYLDNNQLRKAQLEIRKAFKLAPEDSAIKAKKLALDQRIDKLVDVAIEEGKYQYSQGNINAAIKSWQAAKILAPYNDALTERLAKAIRFRERYEALRE